MAYFLRIHKRQKGLYLQIDESFRNKEKKRTDHKSFKSLGYVNDLVSKDIPDPISFYKDYVKQLNAEKENEKVMKISSSSMQVNLGHFIVKSMIDKLNVDPIIYLLAAKRNFQFNLSVLIRQLIYSRIINPCSKAKTVDKVFPTLYNNEKISSDQVYDGINFIGQNYKKYIELFNQQYASIYKRNFSTVFFDCTNYYFEIDQSKNDQQKGPSKDQKKEPIIGQALLLDGNQMPIAMEMYPGNESEKPYIRKLISDMKSRYNITGKTVQVADKGLNCGQNIAEAVKNGDGYVFSKSIHGKNLSDVEKKWVLSQNGYVDVFDGNGKLKYKIKECVDEFEYKFEIDGNKYKRKFKEKRVVSYNPSLAEKQLIEINKQVAKATTLSTAKSAKREEYGDSVKYVNFEGTVSINHDKIDEDRKLAGYNLIVTSEINKTADEIYNIYHSLWRIEESFRITKSYLDARPVYLQNKESIYGHFLICYLALFLLRVLEFNVFNNEINVYDLVNFIRDLTVTKGIGNTYTSNATDSPTLQKIKKVLNINKLDNLFFSEADIEKVYSTKV